VGTNKDRLIAHYIDYIVEQSAREPRASESLYSSDGAKDSCRPLTNVSCQEIEDLQSNHE